jgi:hypothetical protein
LAEKIIEKLRNEGKSEIAKDFSFKKFQSKSKNIKRAQEFFGENLNN